MAGKSGGILIRVLLMAIAFGVIIGYKWHIREKSSQQIQGEIRRAIHELNDWGGERIYVDGLLNRAHRAAFEGAHAFGLRRDSFDANRYATTLFSTMSRLAREEGKTDLADQLAGLDGQFMMEIRNQ